jgi:hypothetical protein
MSRNANLAIFATGLANAIATSSNTFTFGSALYILANGNIGVANSAPGVGLVVSTTDAMRVPVGNTAQRPGTPVSGYFRFSNTTNSFEGYNGTGWTTIGAAATGGGADQIFVLNGQSVTTTYSIPSNYNAASTGPLTINSGVAITIPTGSRWVIL